jgi:hypothetical protein
MLQRGDQSRRLWSAWRSAADEVWQTWEEVVAAPRTARASAYDQHWMALETEQQAAGSLAAHCWAQAGLLDRAA